MGNAYTAASHSGEGTVPGCFQRTAAHPVFLFPDFSCRCCRRCNAAFLPTELMLAQSLATALLAAKLEWPLAVIDLHKQPVPRSSESGARTTRCSFRVRTTLTKGRKIAIPRHSHRRTGRRAGRQAGSIASCISVWLAACYPPDGSACLYPEWRRVTESSQ